MHSRYILLVFGCLLLNAACRPRQAEYNNDSDLEESEEEEDNESVADTYSADDEESRLSEKDLQISNLTKQEHGGPEEVPRSRHLLDLTEGRYLERSAPAADHTAHAKPSSLSNVNINRNREVRDENQSESGNFNEQIRANLKRRQSTNRYNEANDDQQETQQHMNNNRDVGKSNHVQNPDDNQVNKRTLEYATANEEGDMIFEKIRDQVKNEYNANDTPDPEQSRYIKQYYNALQENREMVDDKTREGVRYKLRDRRETKEGSQADTSNLPSSQVNTEINSKAEREDEESAIKRHIKKLSSDELNQLLNSLTEEKRELLKKIIDDSDTSDNTFLNKREITKKAGAVEENNYIESCQSDISKIQGDSSSLEMNTESPSSASTEPTEVSSKQQDSQVDVSEATEKTSEASLISENKLDMPGHNDEALQKKSDNSVDAFNLNVDPKNQADIVANVQVTSSKTENKREVKLEDLEESDDPLEDNKVSGQDYSNDQGYINSQEENLSNMLEEEIQPSEVKNYKREAFYDKQSDLSDSVKSLEESFPNSNAYDDMGPYSGPLVRVKRKNYDQVIKKRSAGLLPDAKVGYFPYKAENDDEDNDEGNEFDDEGFYDRTSNFANNKGIDDNIDEKSEESIRTKNSGEAKSLNENIDSNTSLGSDSDSVLSGVEGVDDNLMFNSGARSRRTAEDEPSVITPTKVKDHSTSLLEEDAKPVSYKEHDAFGALPRNSDGGLVRFKRIRRVKEPNSPDSE